MYFAKAPILILYERIFGIMHWLRAAVYTTLIVSFLGYLGPLLYVAVECSDAEVVDMSSLQACAGFTPRVGLGHGIISLVVDIIIFFLPMPLILKMNLSTEKKIGLALVFMSGIL